MDRLVFPQQHADRLRSLEWRRHLLPPSPLLPFLRAILTKYVAERGRRRRTRRRKTTTPAMPLPCPRPRPPACDATVMEIKLPTSHSHTPFPPFDYCDVVRSALLESRNLSRHSPKIHGGAQQRGSHSARFMMMPSAVLPRSFPPLPSSRKAVFGTRHLLSLRTSWILDFWRNASYSTLLCTILRKLGE